MKKIQNIESSIAALSDEHKLISDYVAKFAKSKKTKDAAFFSELSSFVAFLEKDLHSHFELEELAFFPAVLNGAPAYDSTLIVLALQKEHGIIETRLELILQNREAIAAGRIDDPVIDQIEGLLQILNIHAKRELTELFPMISESIKCRTLLLGYINDMQRDI